MKIMIPFRDNWKKKLVTCLLAGFAFMLLCHGFIMTNPGYSHDSLFDLVRDNDYNQVGLGRFGQVLWREVFGRVTATWMIGMVAAVCMGLAAFLICELCDVRGSVTMVLLTGILITNYTICNSMATYMPWVDIYGGALLLAVTAVYLTYYYKWGFLAGIPFGVAALSLYQPYALCIPALTVIVTLIRVLPEKGSKWKWILFPAKATVMLAAAYGVYRLLLQLLLSRTGIPLFTQYNGITNVGLAENFWGVFWTEIGSAYEKCFDFLLASFRYLPLKELWIAAASVSFAAETILFQQKHVSSPAWKAVCFYLFVLLIPLVFNIQYIVSKTAYHVLMVFSVFFAWTLPVLLSEKNRTGPENNGQPSNARKTVTRISRVLTLVMAAVFLFANVRYANNIYTGKYLRERSTLSVLTRIMARAEAVDGYIPGETPIAIVGRLEHNPVVGETDASYEGPEIGDAERFVSTTYDTTGYLRYYMGYTNLIAPGEAEAIPGVWEMPVYPTEGFARVVDGKLVVKVSDLTD